jgi:hypothetical protein
VYSWLGAVVFIGRQRRRDLCVRIFIKKKGERLDWAFAMASKIPNLPVLMSLANQRYLR